MENKEEVPKTLENVRLLRRRRDSWYNLDEESTDDPYKSPRAGAHPVDVYYIPQSLLVGPSEADLAIDMDAEIQAHEEEMRRQIAVVTPEDKSQAPEIPPVFTAEDLPEIPRAEPEYILLSPCTPPTPPPSPVRPASPTPPFDNNPALLEHIEGAPVRSNGVVPRRGPTVPVFDIPVHVDMVVSDADVNADVRFYDDEDSDDVSLGSVDTQDDVCDRTHIIGRRPFYKLK